MPETRINREALLNLLQRLIQINSVIYLSFKLCYGQFHSRIENVLITERFFDNHYKSTGYADFVEIICVNLRNLRILFRLLRRFYDERIGREVDPAKGQK
jgi:hypothetical protein